MQELPVMLIKEEFQLPTGLLVEAGWGSWDWNKHRRFLNRMLAAQYKQFEKVNAPEPIQLNYLNNLIQGWVNVGWVECDGFTKGEAPANVDVTIKGLDFEGGVR